MWLIRPHTSLDGEKNMKEQFSYGSILPQSQGMATPPKPTRGKGSSQIPSGERITAQRSYPVAFFKSGPPPLDWDDLPPFQPCSSSPFAVWGVQS
jgi:hypothetical protein